MMIHVRILHVNDNTTYFFEYNKPKNANIKLITITNVNDVD